MMLEPILPVMGVATSVIARSALGVLMLGLTVIVWVALLFV